MRRLIIHADDLGLTENVNSGIIKAHLEGCLTSASIMATGTAFDHAIAICRSFPTLDIGVHLTLVGEKPALNENTVKTLLNLQGKFHDHAWQFIRRHVLGLISLDEVRCELDAQIEKVLNTGVEISHLDSHQHLHMLPGILGITVELAKKYRIPAIRFPHEKFHLAMLREWRMLPRIMQLLVLGGTCYLGRHMDALRPHSFYGFLFSGNLNGENFIKILDRLPQDETSEIMCHPGLENPERLYSHWRYHWADELQALLTPEIGDIFSRKGISLISYRELAAK